MVTIRASIHIYAGEAKRKIPFVSGYRPHFLFHGGERTSGAIKLLDRTAFVPGDTGEVEVTLVTAQNLGAGSGVRSSFEFFEGLEAFGAGEVKEVLLNT